jgi:diguanylate cyclase (GGDEF)-like protein
VRNASLESLESVRTAWEDVLEQGRPQRGSWLVQSGAVVAVASFGLAVARLLLDGVGSPVAYALLASAIGFGVAALLCHRRPESRLGPTLLPLVGVAGTTAMAFVEGGLYSEALFWSPFIPLVAMLALGMRGALAFGALVVITTTALLVCQGCGLTAAEAGFTPNTVLRWLGLNSAVGFGVILGAAYLRARARSIARLATEKRKADAAHDRLQVLVNNLPAGVAVTDDEDRFIVVNRKLCEVFKLPADASALVGRNKWDVIGRDNEALADPRGFRRPSQSSPATRGELIGDEVRFADGRAYERDVVPLVLSGQVLGHLWTYHDITARARRADQLRAQIETDDMTALASRSHLSEQCDRACEQGRPFALLFLDLDGFKQINDHQGHAAGDEALRMVADRLRSLVRSSDVVARMGGDEFAVLLRGVSLSSEAAAAAGKILQSLGEPFQLQGQVVAMGASVGVALFPRNGGTTDLLLEAADQAMYRAKRTGKGRIAVASTGLQTGDPSRRRVSA